MTSSDQILDLLDLPVRGAAVGAGLELGLFWALAEGARSSESLGEALGISRGRCESLAALLEAEGLLERASDGWVLAPATRSAIVDGYSEATWQLLAAEARERFEAVHDLPMALRAAPAPRLDVPGYVERMARDPDRARRFTRMLFEIHQPLAARLADELDLDRVGRLMDLGGGSGVVSIALARRWPLLQVTVVDVATVCDAGREIAGEASLGDRIDYLAANFVADPLPGGYGAILECDVAAYSPDLFRKVREALEPSGRFIIVDTFAPDPAGPSQLAWSLVRRLRDPVWEAPTVEGTVAMLDASGFDAVTARLLPSTPGVGGLKETVTIVEARRG